MDILEAIKTRKSIRDFKPDPVPREVITELLNATCQAPSAMNTQPWEFIAISGDVLDKIRKKNIELLYSGAKLEPEHLVVGWPKEGVYRDRQVGVAKQLFKLMDIPREDNEKRAQWMERGFRYFSAPVAIILLTDRMLSESGPLIDIGAAAQTLCLAALSFDLGTCIEDQGVMYPQILREYCNIPESKKILMSIAVGYPNWDFPANKVESEREPVENITTWVGFDK